MVTALALSALASSLASACGGDTQHKTTPPLGSAGEGGALESGGSAGKSEHPGGAGGHADVGGAGQAGEPATGGSSAGEGGASGGADVALAGAAGESAGAQCGDGALSFSGAQFVQLPGTATLQLKTALTLEAWIKTTATVAVESLFLSKHSCGTDNGYFLEIYSNSSDGAHVPNAPAFYVGANTRHVYGTTSVVDGKWHHIAGTWDGTTSTLYVDGTFIASKVVSYDNTNALDLMLGAATSGACRPFVGSMDEVSVWSVARTAQQIAADMGGPIATDTPGLEAYFDFNCAECGKILTDRSPHARHGLLGGSSQPSSNDPTWVTDGPF